MKIFGFVIFKAKYPKQATKELKELDEQKRKLKKQIERYDIEIKRLYKVKQELKEKQRVIINQLERTGRA